MDEKPKSCDPEHAEDIKRLAKEHGLGKKLYDEMLKRKDLWRKETIAIGVVGQSRIGKSSHINAHMRQKVAEVSATKQCTMTCKSYPHPRNPNILLWDVPGVNTLDYTRENYDEKVNLDQFDFVLILTDNIFTDDTLWLANEIQKRRKRYYLIRTKVDIAVADCREDNPELAVEDVLADIRQELVKDLERKAFSTEKFKVYLVNNKDRLQYDFPELETDICQDSVSEMQQEALLITMGSNNLTLLQAKHDLFLSRIWTVALASAAGGAVPIPGVSASVDLAIIVEEVMLYYRGFGLDKAAIAALEELYGKPQGSVETQFHAILQSRYPVLNTIRDFQPWDLADVRIIRDTLPTVVKNSTSVLLPNMALMAGSEAVEDTSKLLLPVVGSGIAAAVSYGVTVYQLRQLLSQMLEAAKIVHAIPLDQESTRMDDFLAPQ